MRLMIALSRSFLAVITINLGFIVRGFSLRGKDKVQGQWRLYCLVHNVKTLAKYGGLSG